MTLPGINPDEIEYGTPAIVGRRPASVVRLTRARDGTIISLVLRDEKTEDEIDVAWRERKTVYTWDGGQRDVLIRSFPGPPAQLVDPDGRRCVIGRRR